MYIGIIHLMATAVCAIIPASQLGSVQFGKVQQTSESTMLYSRDRSHFMVSFFGPIPDFVMSVSTGSYYSKKSFRENRKVIGF